MAYLLTTNGDEGKITASDVMKNSYIVFRGTSDDWVIRIDEQGFHYRGQLIEDAGEAHRLFVDFLRRHQAEIDLAASRLTRATSMPYPSYCCPRCGEQIGWVGRFFNAIIPGWHKCRPS